MKIRRRLFLILLATAFAVPTFGQETPKKLLVVTVTTGYRHASIATAEKVLQQLATESGKFTVHFVRQPAGQPKAPQRPAAPKGGLVPDAERKKFEEDTRAYEAAVAAWMPRVIEALKPLSLENLKNYDGVIFANTTGDLPLPDRQGFIEWIGGGKAFIGVHAATDTFHGFPAYISMIGGEFRTHGPQLTVECLNEDPAHAACAHLPAKWTLFDEIYQFDRFHRAGVHGLLRLDRRPDAKDPSPGDYPVAWCRYFSLGRVFYTALGHRDDLWDSTWSAGERKNDPAVAKAFQQHLLGGILWALELAPGDGTPPPVEGVTP